MTEKIKIEKINDKVETIEVSIVVQLSRQKSKIFIMN